MGKKAKPKGPPPAWWNTETHGKWTAKREDANNTFVEVLGHDVQGNTAALDAWAGIKSPAERRRLMSLSEEARLRDVDPAKFGNKAVDIAALSEKDKGWYEAWKTGHDRPFYDGDLKLLDWQKNFGSLEVYKGLQDGTIVNDGGIFVVSPEAVTTYGQKNLKFRQASTLVAAPDGVSLNVGPDSVKFKWKGTDETTRKHYEDKYAGYSFTQVVKNQSHGIGGFADRALEKVGVANWARNIIVPVVAAVAAAPLGPAAVAAAAAATSGPLLDENLHLGDKGYFIVDPANLVTGIGQGSAGVQKNLSGGADLFNTTEERVAARQGVVKGAAKVAAALIPGGGPLISAGLSALDSFNAAAAGTSSWGDAFVDAATSAGLAAIGMGGWSTVGKVGASAALSGAGAAVKGGSWGDVGISVGTSLAGSFAASAARSATMSMGMSSSNWQAATQGATSFGARYAGARWAGFDNNEALVSGVLGATSAIAGAKTEAARPGYAESTKAADSRSFLGNLSSEYRLNPTYSDLVTYGKDQQINPESVRRTGSTLFTGTDVTGRRVSGPAAGVRLGEDVEWWNTAGWGQTAAKKIVAGY